MISVVLCTYNRADRVGTAITSVLGQTLEDFELVVVDDGSVDNTREVVNAIGDARLQYVHRENGGLSAARNTGVASSSGRFVTFLDDDDQALPRWLQTFHDALGDREAVATCAAYAVNIRGQVSSTMSPAPLGPAYADYRGLFLPGTFAVPRTAYDAIGGFAEGVQYCHHAEFALRLLPFCRAAGWPVIVIDEPLLRWENRPPEQRPETLPARVLVGMDYVLSHHRDQLARSPETLANCYAKAGVAAARLGRYREARHHLRQAVSAQPRSARAWLRLGVALTPPFGDAVWRARRYRSAAAATASA
ncbi:MAG TPA: glycosyltransferase [Acidimicrobiia bacterium]|nr:glycosyltransferase [Acidimicrobiia bacterium]